MNYSQHPRLGGGVALYRGMCMETSWKYVIAILLIAAIAAAFRLPKLAQRPLHGDEAIHADKCGTILEKGVYVYDPFEYHGPTLNYFTLIPAWLQGQKTYQQIDEFTIRIVPVAFGVLLVFSLLFIGDGLGWPAAIVAAILTAVSHAMVFYSRYYIQEILLVYFTFGVIICGWRYAKSKRVGWILMAGIFLGLMHATKETFIIAVASMTLALGLTRILRGGDDNCNCKVFKKINWKHLIVGLLAATVVSTMLFSSLMKNPRGIIDSVLTYKTYLNRAGHNQFHLQPWYYYLQMLTWTKIAPGPAWTEAFILVFAAVGFVAAMFKRGVKGVDFDLIRFIAFYTIIMTVVYSIIQYKTPWCLLGFFHGMILLAGVGVVALVQAVPRNWQKTAVVIILAHGIGHLGWQAYMGAFKYYDDHANPYVYSHPGRDVFKVVKYVEQMAALHDDGKKMYVEVICPGGDYWPLPWYLRSFENVGYFSEVDMTKMPAPVIIAYASLDKEVLHKIYNVPPPGQRNMYVPLFEDYIELRPTIELNGFVMNDLWEKQLMEPDIGDLKAK